MLQNSHYVPAGMYRRVRDDKRRNPNPVVITPAITSTTSKQTTDYLLCHECEERFSHGGESWIAQLVATDTHFPLRDRLELAIPEQRLSESIAYSGLATGIDTAKLGYFALSMVWRGAVHRWPRPLGGDSTLLDLGGMEEQIRRYLVGEAPFPQDAAVVVHICDDRTSQLSILEPCKRADNGTSFEILTLGIHFFVFLGQTVTPAIRQMCCVTSKDRLLFVRNCQERLSQRYEGLAKTSKRTKNVISEWPD
jgi:hypothetical protein